MKKTIAILLILVIGMVGVFATNNKTQDLTLSTTVAARYNLVIASAKAAAVAPVGETPGKTLVESFEELTPVSSVPFTTSNESGSLYVNYMTNQRIKATVTTTMKPLSPDVLADGSANPVTSEIGYTVTVVGGATGGQTDATHKVIASTHSALGLGVTFIEEASITDGLRVVSREFSIALNEADWDAASATEYSTTWTVLLSVE